MFARVKPCLQKQTMEELNNKLGKRNFYSQGLLKSEIGIDSQWQPVIETWGRAECLYSREVSHSWVLLNQPRLLFSLISPLGSPVN